MENAIGAEESITTSSETSDALLVVVPVLHVVGPKDVLCSRGRGANCNPGNVLYSNLIKEYKEQYQLESTHKAKQSIVRNVLDEFRASDPPGRFLKQRNDDDETIDNNTMLYETLTESESIKKISQALREKPKVQLFSKEGKKKSISGRQDGPISSKKTANVSSADMKQSVAELEKIPVKQSSRGTSRLRKKRLNRRGTTCRSLGISRSRTWLLDSRLNRRRNSNVYDDSISSEKDGLPVVSNSTFACTTRSEELWNGSVSHKSECSVYETQSAIVSDPGMDSFILFENILDDDSIDPLI